MCIKSYSSRLTECFHVKVTRYPLLALFVILDLFCNFSPTLFAVKAQSRGELNKLIHSTDIY